MSDEKDLRVTMAQLHRFFTRKGLAANDEAQDAVQETLLREFQASPKGGAEPVRWLFGIARNVLYERYRERRREVPRESIEISGGDCECEVVVDARVTVTAIRGLSRADQVALLAADSPELFTEEELEEFRSLGDEARRSRVFRARGRVRRAA